MLCAHVPQSGRKGLKGGFMGQVGAERYIIILEKNYKIRNSAKYYIRKKKRGLITREYFRQIWITLGAQMRLPLGNGTLVEIWKVRKNQPGKECGDGQETFPNRSAGIKDPVRIKKKITWFGQEEECSQMRLEKDYYPRPFPTLLGYGLKMKASPCIKCQCHILSPTSHSFLLLAPSLAIF